MPDILYVTLEGFELTLGEQVGISAFAGFDAPEGFSNFVVSEITAESALSYPEKYSNFIYLPIIANVGDSHTLAEVMCVKLVSAPLLFILSEKDNVSFLAHQGVADISSLITNIALLVDISSNAAIFEYSDVVTRLLFRSLAGYSLLPFLVLESSIGLTASASDSFLNGLVLLNTVSIAGSAGVSWGIEELLKIIFDASLSFNFTVSYDDHLRLIGACHSLFRSADLSTIGISANALIDSVLYTAILLREELIASNIFTSVLNTTASSIYNIESSFAVTGAGIFANTISLLTDTGIQLFIPGSSTLTAAWYVLPKAISMHTLSPESVCEWNDVVYMAFDDGIYVFDDTSVSDTGLVFNFGDLSSPIFKRLGDMFISGAFDSLTVAVDMDDVRNTYITDINKIKFAKGHKGYNIKLFIEGLLQLDALDILLISLSKRRRYG